MKKQMKSNKHPKPAFQLHVEIQSGNVTVHLSAQAR